MDDAQVVREALGAKSVHFLGDGTFGETWKAVGVLEPGHPYAVKLLKPDHFNKKLLEREVDGLNGFAHEGVVRLHEVRKVVLNSRERHALICEYIEGGSVRQALHQKGLPTKSELVNFAIGLLDAVSMLHARDLIHRDIKPDNVMLRNGEWAKPVLIDFGLSRPVSGGTMTLYPQRVGSVPWMSPEQLQGNKARKAADLWACGIILFSLATGRHPFFDRINLSDLDEDELVDLVSVPAPPLSYEDAGSIAHLINRLIIPDPPGARGSARRAVRDLKGD